MGKKKKIAIIILIIGIGIVAGYNYVMYGGARDITSEKTDFTVTSKSIVDEFALNVDVANKKYLEKAVAVAGVITSVKGLEIILDKSIICNLKVQDNTIKEGQKLTVKGRIVGFDDLMGELKLDQCFTIKNETK